MSDTDSLEGFAQRLDKKVALLKDLQKQDRELMEKLWMQISVLRTRSRARSIEIAKAIGSVENARTRIDAQDIVAIGKQTGE